MTAEKLAFILSIIFVLLLLVGSTIYVFFSPASQPGKLKPATVSDRLEDDSNQTAEIKKEPSGPSPTKKPEAIPIQAGSIGPIHQDISATVFWVGEPASEENNYISNEISMWDSDWLESYGGIDGPEELNSFYPASFTPLENPFYVALPYSDIGKRKQTKFNVVKIPWYEEAKAANQPIIKNRWIRIGREDKICFAQWEDAGPGETDDFDYVFGTSQPKNSFSGIDLSPAVRDCLSLKGNGKVWWQFIDQDYVPDGPWKQIVTTSLPD